MDGGTTTRNLSDDLGRVVAERRRALGLSQAAAAAAIGISGTTLSRWESGVRRPPESQLGLLFDLLRFTSAEVAELGAAGRPAYCGRIPELGRFLGQRGVAAAEVASATGRVLEDVTAWLGGRRSAPARFLDQVAQHLGLPDGAELLEQVRSTLRQQPLTRLQRARADRGLTQAQLAQAMGVSRQTIWRWESQSGGPPPWRVEQLTRILGVPRSTVVGDDLGASLLSTGMTHELPEILHDLRRRSGLNRAQAARCLGISRVTVLRWERGISAPRPRDMARLAQLYGLSQPEQGLLQRAREMHSERRIPA